MVWAVEFCTRNSAVRIFFSFSFPITLPVHIICSSHAEVMLRSPNLGKNRNLG